MDKTISQKMPAPQVKDNVALWAGIAFSVLFTGLIYLLGGRLERFPHLPDTGASWYFWKLPEPTVLGRVSAWGFYLAHQIAVWWTIYYAQTRVAKYTSGLHRINVIALGINALFISLHLVQTQLWYDGLAQDVSIWSSQWSVILLLVWVLLMENKRRGLFFGQKVPLGQRVTQIARKYHGYYFAWAVIYTFWYHPMEATSGHLIGFFYTLLLMLQASLMFTRVHRNRYWTFALEFLVLAHGTLVAVMQANGMWPMFFFGFAGILIVTQLHGIGLPRLLRALIVAAYFVFALFVYWQRDITMIHQITWIPIVDYVVVFVLAGLFALGIAVSRRLIRAS